MKKIALLLTIVCTSQLYTMKRIYGMEPEPSYETLPPELKQEIINTALATNKKLSKKIEMIKNLSALHGVQYDNLKDFTTLVHILNKERVKRRMYDYKIEHKDDLNDGLPDIVEEA